jgi:hypothetical protein
MYSQTQVDQISCRLLNTIIYNDINGVTSTTNALSSLTNKRVYSCPDRQLLKVTTCSDKPKQRQYINVTHDKNSTFDCRLTQLHEYISSTHMAAAHTNDTIHEGGHKSLKANVLNMSTIKRTRYLW